jgi:hypothetical protein
MAFLRYSEMSFGTKQEKGSAMQSAIWMTLSASESVHARILVKAQRHQFLLPEIHVVPAI